MSVTDVEQWRVVDRWWTAEPAVREYRAYLTADGWRVTEMLLDDVWVEQYREREDVPA